MTPSIHAHPWYNRRHHARSGFQNPTVGRQTPPFFKSAFWLLKHGLEPRRHTLPRVHTGPPPSDPPERLRITWIGHSSLLVQTPHRTLLTDPVFSDRASPLSFAGPRREPALPFSLADLPPVDQVLISHDHYDHLDHASLRAIDQRFQPLFFAPLGVAPTLRGWGIERVVEMDWWQYADLDGARVHCTPAQHFSGRGLFNRNGTLWASWYLETDDLTLYYAGDSGYAPHFAEIRERLGAPEVALLPIGAYRPRWFMRVVHVNPAESVQAFLDLQAQHFVPTHWGTFDLSEELLHEPPHDLLAAATKHGVADRIRLLDIGEAFALDAREAPSQAA